MIESACSRYSLLHGLKPGPRYFDSALPTHSLFILVGQCLNFEPLLTSGIVPRVYSQNAV